MLGINIKYDITYLNTLVLYEHQLTPAELAKKIDYSRSHVYKVLNEELDPSEKFIKKVIFHLNLSLAQQIRLKYSVPEQLAKRYAEHLKPIEHFMMPMASNY